MTAMGKLRDRLAELADLQALQMLAGWDQLVMMPPGGAAERGHQVGTLARILHDHATSPEIGEWLAELDELESSELESDILRLARRDWERARRVPTDLAAELSKAHSDGQESWQAARANDDFDAFAPALERNIELARAYGRCLDEEGRGIYQSLIDDFDFGLRTEELRRLFSELGARLAPLVEEARGRAAIAKPAVPREVQRRAVEAIMKRVGVDSESWRLDVSTHPFSASMARTDQRMTTRYNDGGIESLLSSLHEFGHALYERQVDPELDRTNLGTRHLDVDPRVPEQAVGEPRRAPPGLRRGAGRRARRGRSRDRCAGAARRPRRRRALADTRLGGSAHLSAAHRAALRTGAGADRRRPRGGRSARSLAGRGAPPAGARGPLRRPRLPAGRALERGRVRLLPELCDGLPDRGLVVGRDGARARSPRRGSARAQKSLRSRTGWGATCTATGVASTPSRSSSGQRAGVSRSSPSCATSRRSRPSSPARRGSVSPPARRRYGRSARGRASTRRSRCRTR